jgi:hypothetical protein
MSLYLAYGIQESLVRLKKTQIKYISYTASTILIVLISIIWFDGVHYSAEIIRSKEIEISRQRALLDSTAKFRNNWNPSHKTILSGIKSPLAAIKLETDVTQFIPFNWIPLTSDKGKLGSGLNNAGSSRDDIIRNICAIDFIIIDEMPAAQALRRIIDERRKYTISLKNGTEIIISDNTLIKKK